MAAHRFLAKISIHRFKVRTDGSSGEKIIPKLCLIERWLHLNQQRWT
jgi:hypothetical protein